MDIRAKIEEANQRVTEIFMKARPVWTKIAPAIDVIPGMEKNKILVAGPPIAVEDITIPVRTAVCGAAVHDGLAKTPREAWEKVEAGEIIIDSAQNHDCGCSAGHGHIRQHAGHRVRGSRLRRGGLCADSSGEFAQSAPVGILR